MPQLFGDRSNFAIEAGAEPGGHTGSTVWGYMCIWCGGQQLGDLDDRHCGLFDAYSGFQDTVASLDSLWDNAFICLNDQAIFNHLDVLLYGYRQGVEIVDNRTVEDCKRDWDRWGRFDFLTNWGEPFNGCKAFLLHPPGPRLRVLFRAPSEDSVVSKDISVLGFLAAVSAFSRWYQKQDQGLKNVSREELLNRRQLLKSEFRQLYDEALALFFEHDPQRINFGSNTDEYSPEVGTILPRLKECESEGDVNQVVTEEFSKWFGSPAPDGCFAAISAELWQLWQRFRST
jgi:hypothetical protein